MTMLVTGYKSKKELKAAIGSQLQYEETSMFGPEYKSTGSFVVAHDGGRSNRSSFIKNKKIKK